MMVWLWEAEASKNSGSLATPGLQQGGDRADEGRFGVTKNDSDRYHFKVPGLRNVAKTPPYFHDGSVDDLSQAVRIMAKLQLGRDLGAEQVPAIVAFLHSLTGPIPTEFGAEVSK